MSFTEKEEGNEIGFWFDFVCVLVETELNRLLSRLSNWSSCWWIIRQSFSYKARHTSATLIEKIRRIGPVMVMSKVDLNFHQILLAGHIV